MYSIVKRLRCRGEPRPDREFYADPGVPGDLTIAGCAGVLEAKLSGDDGSRQEPIIPILYHVTITSMHGDKILLYGVEDAGNGRGYDQEWAVKLLPGYKRRSSDPL